MPDPQWTPPDYTPPTTPATQPDPQWTPPGSDQTGYDPFIGTGATTPTGTLGDPSNQSWWQQYLNSPSSFGGGGGGFGGGGASTAAAGGTIAGASIPQWLQAINTLLASQHKGSFVQVPQTPQQQALYNWAAQRMMAMPDNTANLYNFAAERAMAPSATFDINAAMQGKPAYTPSQPLTAPQLATLLQGYGGAPYGSPPQSTTSNSNPNSNPNPVPNFVPRGGGGTGHGGRDVGNGGAGFYNDMMKI